MKNDSPWGMVLHYPDGGLIDLLGQGGVTWLRVETNFEYQTRPGLRPRDFTSWGAMNVYVDSANRNGQYIYCGLKPHYPGWILRGRPTSNNDDDPRPFPRPRHDRDPTPEEEEAWNMRFTHWGNFVQLVIDELAPKGVTHFNIGNEPNDAKFYPYGTDDYLKALTVAAQVIHSAGCKVIAPDIATGSDHNPWGFLRQCLGRLRDERQYLDAISIHGYPSHGDELSQLLQQLYGVVPVLREYGVTAPVWLTETGVDNTRSDAVSKNGDRVMEICQWIGEGTVTVRVSANPKLPPQKVPKFLKKVFFFVWSDDQDGGGKYAWLSPPPALAPLPYLWNAYRKVTGKL